MKKTILSLCLLAAFTVQAQTANSGSDSASNSGAASQSAAGIAASNSGNVTATGNQNASRSDSASQSGAQSGSLSGAVGNNVTFNTPSSQTIRNEMSGSTTSNNNTTLNGTQTVNNNVTGGTHDTSDATVRNVGDSTQRVISSGGVNNYSREEVHYSGSQTIKSAPAIAMSGPASGPCTGVSGGVGLSGPGWGIGLNGSAVMDDCRIRENTRVLGMGMQSIDGAANPSEKGEAMVMFMDAMRGLASYNASIVGKQGERK